MAQKNAGKWAKDATKGYRPSLMANSYKALQPLEPGAQIETEPRETPRAWRERARKPRQDRQVKVTSAPAAALGLLDAPKGGCGHGLAPPACRASNLSAEAQPWRPQVPQVPQMPPPMPPQMPMMPMQQVPQMRMMHQMPMPMQQMPMRQMQPVVQVQPGTYMHCSNIQMVAVPQGPPLGPIGPVGYPHGTSPAPYATSPAPISHAREGDCLRLAQVLPAPEKERELPSKGSAQHALKSCKPCAFVWQGCRNGTQCEFCHLCEPGERKRRKKERRMAKRES
ncbi:unnamed protein product [Effrenium voratum]|nr:unnamed protein product [Effrenium voratum]